MHDPKPDAADWLLDILNDGQPVLVDRVRALAAVAGIPGAALRRAWRDLGVGHSHRDGLAYISMPPPRHRPCATFNLKARTA